MPAPLTCHACGKVCSTRRALRRHHRTACAFGPREARADNQRRCACPVCGRVVLVRDLPKHRTHHGKPDGGIPVGRALDGAA